MFAVYRTRKFEKEYKKVLSSEEIKKLEVFERKQLSVNPFIGDHLSFPFLREKKLGSKRVYYLV